MIWLSLCGLLTFWQPTSQLLALDVCLRKMTFKQMSLKSHC
ncbi:TPA: DUF645 family protein [Vibrio cholerae]|nr:DUF645 family protein [Vibrio cholerae]HDI3312241.1 DUF645 family protein [Vibrio cholerae]HDI3346203.1 DUF645 family protein [Vibrio cholerae]HDL9513752.1 DUF645 family protein [Vibrio cholerae]